MTAVTFRDVEEADKARLLAWRNAPEVARWMYGAHVITPEEHERWWATALRDPRRRYWVIEVGGAPAGLVNLYDIDTTHGRCTWAFYLGDPGLRGRGVGAYVEYWVLEHVFETMGLHKLWCEVLVGNEAVWKMHQRYGFQVEARLRDHVLKDGAYQEVLGLGLLQEEWRAARAGCRARLERAGFSLPG
ncbi:MAG TPA: UDP-4-amino-4,6-dideoxy-N-acetyl-beta-L-altrosamine N-acetyltransferase [Caulobacteraceae bacterium]|jgi:UDP-4-amino-4,6-dideoxy-N-acetyl-beta-L-altrosamine N-acetyltransferase